jgi:hypothetical protein
MKAKDMYTHAWRVARLEQYLNSDKHWVSESILPIVVADALSDGKPPHAAYLFVARQHLKDRGFDLCMNILNCL